MIERIVVLEQASVIQPEHLPLGFEGGIKPVTGQRQSAARYTLPDEGINLEEFEKELFGQALAKADHNMSKAANLLRVSYDSFRNHIKKYKIGN